MRVLVLKGQSQYGGTRLFADEAASAFGRQGHEAVVLDLGDGATLQADMAAAASGHPFDLVFSFNIMGDFRSDAGLTVSQMFGCQHVVWHTDYILGAWSGLAGTPSETILMVVDPTQIDALVAATGENRHKVRFFPHPAVGQAAPDEPDVESFVAARPIPVLWSGGFQIPTRPWASAAEITQQVMDTALELSLSLEWIAPHLALTRVLRAFGYDVSDPAHRHTLSSATLLDAEVRRTRRHALLLTLAESEVELHICGPDWQPHLHLFKNATYHGEVPMTRMIEFMRMSRIVINSNGNFGCGSHERPFSASLAGAATFSDFSQYYAAEFQHGENIEMFSWLRLSEAMEQLRSLSNDLERCWTYARSAKRLTLAKHTWDKQISDILDTALT